MDHVLGQDAAVNSLRAQLAAGRAHHAYIFHGPPGVGKFTTAMAFAKLLLCPAAQTDLMGRFAACGQCGSCVLLPDKPSELDQSPAEGWSLGGRDEKAKQQAKPAPQEEDDEASLASPHPDLHVVTKELARYSDDASTRNRKLRSIPVEVVRQHLIQPASLAPQMGKAKVFIVDEAELLNPAGQNAMLKTLEEPPPGTTLILVTASEDRLLPTIRSRCHRVAFASLDDGVIERWVESHASDCTPTLRHWLVGFADGSLGRAKLALRFGLDSWAESVLPAIDQLARGKAAATLGSTIAAQIDQLAGDWADAHKGGSKEAANHMSAGLMWSMIARHARHKLATLSEQCDLADPASAEALLDPWLGVIDAIEQARSYHQRNVNLTLVCDQLSMSLHQALMIDRHAAAAGR